MIMSQIFLKPQGNISDVPHPVRLRSIFDTVLNQPTEVRHVSCLLGKYKTISLRSSIHNN